MATSKLNKSIGQLIDGATEIALKEIERLARIVLVKNPKKTREFCMAMGSFCFYKTKDGDSMYGHEMDELVGYQKLADFIGEWDDILKLTGEPMQFTATGKKITRNW